MPTTTLNNHFVLLDGCCWFGKGQGRVFLIGMYHDVLLLLPTIHHRTRRATQNHNSPSKGITTLRGIKCRWWRGFAVLVTIIPLSPSRFTRQLSHLPSPFFSPLVWRASITTNNSNSHHNSPLTSHLPRNAASLGP